jgi:hypothetical protein
MTRLPWPICFCAFAGGDPVIPVELYQVLDKVDSCWTRWIPRNYKDSFETLAQVDRARFVCGMCYNMAARVIGLVNPKREKEVFRWIRDLNNKTKRHIDTNRWLTMYFEIWLYRFRVHRRQRLARRGPYVLYEIRQGSQGGPQVAVWISPRSAGRIVLTNQAL